MKTMGRRTIFANYTEEQLLTGTPKEIEAKVLDILNNSIGLHEENKSEIIYLQNYLYGDQDIKNKKKHTRTDINNKGVENWAWAFQDWKKAFLVGKPIQYAPLDNKANEEITKLNNYVNYEDKDQLDQDIYEDIFTVGRGYRYVNSSPDTEDDEAPIELLNLDVKDTEVVYSSSISHEQLLAFVQVSKKYIAQEVDPNTGKMASVDKRYNEYNVYTRNMLYLISDKYGPLKIINKKPIIHNIHIITEYYFNRKRMSALEICKDIFDDINYVENLDKDDIESFVNAIMVFTNAEVDKKSMDAIKEFGAVSIKSTDQKKASVELLQSRLKSLDTQIYYLRKLQALHSILSVPQASQNGEISNAETGKADSGISNLKVSNVDIKFSRDLSDNLLNKTQALINLTTAQIPPEIRNAVIGLFSDPVSVTRLQEQYIKEREALAKQINDANYDNSNENNPNEVNEQNNKLQKVEENNNQGQ